MTGTQDDEVQRGSRRNLWRRLRSERGASAIDSALLVALIAIVAIGGLKAVGASVGGEDTETATEALGGEPVTVDENTEKTASAANGAGGNSGTFGSAATGVSNTGLGEVITGDEGSGYWNTHSAGSSAGNWDVLSGSVDLSVSHSSAFNQDEQIEGNFIDINGYDAGHIKRDVSVIPNTTYNLSIDLGENGYGGPAAKTMEVIWNGQVVSTLEVDLPQHETRTFTVQLPPSATGDGVLEFRSTNPGHYGVLIDNPTMTLISNPN